MKALLYSGLPQNKYFEKIITELGYDIVPYQIMADIKSGDDIKLNVPVPVHNWMLNEISAINEKYNLNGPKPFAVNKIANKFNFYNLLTELNIPRPSYCVQLNTEADYDVKYPAVIKPWAFSGSKEVKIVENKHEAIKHANTYPDSKFLLEEFVKGKYVGLNGSIVNKKLHIWGCQLAQLCYTDCPYPVMPLYWTEDIELPASVITYLELIFNAVKLDNTTTQIELFVDENTHELKSVIELNLRQGVTGLPVWNQLYAGDDPLKESIKLAAGEPCSFNTNLKQNMASLRPNIGGGRIVDIKWPEQTFNGIVEQNLIKGTVLSANPVDCFECNKLGRILVLDPDVNVAIAKAYEYQNNIITIRENNTAYVGNKFVGIVPRGKATDVI